MKMMNELVNTFKLQGSFTRSLVYIFSSNALIYIFNLIFYPVITRIFAPEAYAAYTIWLILFNNLTVLGILGYSEALIITESKFRYYKLAGAVGFMSITIISFLGIVFVFTKDIFWSWFETNNHFWWISLAFPMAFIAIVQNLMNMGTVKFNFLERAAKANTYIRFVSKILVIIIGWLGLRTGLGILVGDICFMLAIIFFLLPWKKTMLIWRELLRFDFKSGVRLLKDNIEFPKFAFPTLWLVTLIQQIPLWLIGSWYKESELGLYSFCFGVLGVPVNLLTKSFRPVFFHKNMEMRSIGDEERKVKIRKVVKLLLVLMLLFLVFGFWGIDMLYDLIFSEKWKNGKRLMQILLIGSVGIIIGSPMASVFKVNQKLRLDLLIRLFSFICLLMGSLVTLNLANVSFISFSLVYNILYLASFLVFFTFQLREFKFDIRERFIILFKILLVLGVSVAATELLKILVS